jgi:DNA invertase Pin-like site-specific DNA recombinase
LTAAACSGLRSAHELTDCKLPASTRREFDVVMAWSVDRLGRSRQDLVAFLSDLHALGIDLFLHGHHYAGR